jgi:hypothetical protein
MLQIEKFNTADYSRNSALLATLLTAEPFLFMLRRGNPDAKALTQVTLWSGDVNEALIILHRVNCI